MNKTVKKVFMLIALLVGIFLAWQLIFNKGGILRTGYNAVADVINGRWKEVTGGNTEVVAKWGEGNNSNAADNGQGSTIGRKNGK